MMKKQRKAQLASGVKLKPEYKGPAPKPNRFNIRCVVMGGDVGAFVCLFVLNGRTYIGTVLAVGSNHPNLVLPHAGRATGGTGSTAGTASSSAGSSGRTRSSASARSSGSGAWRSSKAKQKKTLGREQKHKSMASAAGWFVVLSFRSFRLLCNTFRCI
jgi:hypothetical protein